MVLGFRGEGCLAAFRTFTLLRQTWYPMKESNLRLKRVMLAL
jgi:hypothetical protein